MFWMDSTIEINLVQPVLGCIIKEKLRRTDNLFSTASTALQDKKEMLL
jgi:hypothetical protein